MPCKLKNRNSISDDNTAYTFELPDGSKKLELNARQHIQCGFHLRDRMVVRPYTPTRPLLPANNEDDSACDNLLDNDADALRDGVGSFDLTVKTYFLSKSQPGGTLSNILDCMPIGEGIEIRGPSGGIIYRGHGTFSIEGTKRSFSRISLVLGGSGLTPGYSLIARALLTKDDSTLLRVIDANNSEDDILLRDELGYLENRY